MDNFNCNSELNSEYFSTETSDHPEFEMLDLKSELSAEVYETMEVLNETDQTTVLEMNNLWNICNDGTTLTETRNFSEDFSQLYSNSYNQLLERCSKAENSGLDFDGLDNLVIPDTEMPWLLGYKVEEIWNGCLMSTESGTDSAKPDKNKRKKYKQNKGVTLADNDDINNNAQNIPERKKESNPLAKPPYTYTELIDLALEDKGLMTVSGIYKWIAERYPYFKLESDRWKNSVRHNLSINPQFRKLGKKPSGAGHLWSKLSSDDIVNADGLNENIRNILKTSASQVIKQNNKKAKNRNRVKEKLKKEEKPISDCEATTSYKIETFEKFECDSTTDEFSYEEIFENITFENGMIEEEVVADYVANDYLDEVEILDTSDNTSQLLIEGHIRLRTETPSYNYNVNSNLFEMPDINMKLEDNIFES